MIRTMKETDVSAVAALEKLCFSEPWSERSIAAELSNELSYWLVWEDDGTVVGYVGSQSCPPESDVMNVAVNPAYRGRGIGAALMETLMRDLQQNGMESLTLEVRVSNEPAVCLYQKLGFVQVGRRKGYYVNPKEDALILRKELKQC